MASIVAEAAAKKGYGKHLVRLHLAPFTGMETCEETAGGAHTASSNEVRCVGYFNIYKYTLTTSDNSPLLS